MAAPIAPLQVCVLVEYPNGLAISNNPPRVWVLARIDPVDAVSSGILMRVERCTGASCSGFAFLGNGTIEYVGTSTPQGEFSSVAAFNTTYRYRVRFENSDGAGPFSPEIQISTASNGTSACDTGDVTTLQSEIAAYDEATYIEERHDEVFAYDLTIIIEAGGFPLPVIPPPDPPPDPPPGGGGGFGCEDDL